MFVYHFFPYVHQIIFVKPVWTRLMFLRDNDCSIGRHVKQTTEVSLSTPPDSHLTKNPDSVPDDQRNKNIVLSALWMAYKRLPLWPLWGTKKPQTAPARLLSPPPIIHPYNIPGRLTPFPVEHWAVAQQKAMHLHARVCLHRTKTTCQSKRLNIHKWAQCCVSVKTTATKWSQGVVARYSTQGEGKLTSWKMPVDCRCRGGMAFSPQSLRAGSWTCYSLQYPTLIWSRCTYLEMSSGNKLQKAVRWRTHLVQISSLL